MGSAIFSMLKMLFGGGLAGDISSWAKTLLGFAADLFTASSGGASLFSSAIKGITGAGIALLIVFFLVNITRDATSSMLSVDKVIAQIIKLFVAFTILLNLSPVMGYACHIGQAGLTAFQEAGTKISKNITGTGDVVMCYFFTTSGGELQTTFPSSYEKLQKMSGTVYKKAHISKVTDSNGDIHYSLGTHSSGFKVSKGEAMSDYSGVLDTITSIPTFMLLAIPTVFCMLGKVVAFMLLFSTYIILMVRIIFSPLATASLFDESSRDAGMRYIKGIFADFLCFAAMVVIATMTDTLRGQIIAKNASEELTKKFGIKPGSPYNTITLVASDDAPDGWKTFGAITSLDTTIWLVVAQLACTGSFAMAAKVTHDAIGA